VRLIAKRILQDGHYGYYWNAETATRGGCPAGYALPNPSAIALRNLTSDFQLCIEGKRVI
jgi:hypothetical protein